MAMNNFIKTPDLPRLRQWVYEARVADQEWRAESWRDAQMFDGGRAQWTDEDWDEAIAAGLNPLTINRTFPSVNLILGTQSMNGNNITAKARTQKDGEISQVMTEGISFVLDQNMGEWLIGQGFADSIVPGFGCLHVGLNPDPRREKLRVAYRDWKEIHFDPYGGPWLHPDTTRYVFHEKWVQIDELQALFPEKAKDLADHCQDLGGDNHHFDYADDDLANIVEESRQTLIGADWVDDKNKRVRPVEMWYGQWTRAWFCRFRDGRVLELHDNLPAMDQLEMVQQAYEIVAATVKKIRVATFVGDMELQHIDSPYGHNNFPFVPFVGYVDRYNLPYGVPRQIRGQDEETNKRRTMALALLKSRRVIAESDVVDDPDTGLQELWEEANKLDGLIVVRPGKLQNGLKIIEQADLAPAQVQLMEQSEREIQEISGSNNERMGLQSNAVSGAAIDLRREQGSLMTATLFSNLRRSMKMLGELIVSGIQDFWTEEKVLRVTDRVSGSERFVVLNQQMTGPDGKTMIKNNITQGRFDLVVVATAKSDTVREQNMNMIIEWVKKSPPEVIPHLMNLAFELSDMPNKDQLLAKIKPILGIDPTEEDMSPEEIKQKTIQMLEAQQAKAQQDAEYAEQGIQADLMGKLLENKKLEAEIAEIVARTKIEAANAVTKMVTEKAKADTAEANVGITAFRAETERKDKEKQAQLKKTESKKPAKAPAKK